MSEGRWITAVFADPAAFGRALVALREAGIIRLRAYSPVGLEEFDDLLPSRSPVRWFSLAAGFTGAFLGYWLCIGSSFLYNLIVGGKPVVSWIPFTVIGFELTILTSALVTVASVLVYSRLYPRETAPEYDPEFSSDRFGIAVWTEEGSTGETPVPPGGRAAVVELLQKAGTERIRGL
jgi:molybdopterin-containing oxidoreductase family membrane subunit